MKKRSISFSPPDISELEIAEVAEALRSGWITTGPRTKMLERRYGLNYMQPPAKELQGIKLEGFVKIDLEKSYKEYKGQYYCKGKRTSKVINNRWVKKM